MSEIIKALESDLQAVIFRHSHITGKEFQQTALRTAEAYFSADDVDVYYSSATILAEAVARELARLDAIDR